MKTGTYGGLVYDWLHEIAKYTGWQYEFITGDPDTLLSSFIAGENDIMGGMYYYDGYEKMFNYPEYVMGSNYNLLIYPQSDTSIKSFDYTTLNGKRIGVLRKATSKIERLQKFRILIICNASWFILKTQRPIRSAWKRKKPICFWAATFI